VHAPATERSIVPTAWLLRRVRTAAITVPVLVLAAGAALAIRQPAYVLVAAAVVFGWSQLAGA
jgi:hypothetical protein